MRSDSPSPLRATDSDGIVLARRLVAGAATAALAVIDPDDGGPYVGRARKVRALWRDRHPRSKLCVDFAYFRFMRFALAGGLFNGGLGEAYALSEKDLTVGRPGAKPFGRLP